MAIESGNHIADLDSANPAGSNTKSQGDDHIRLIKQVLLNTFAGFPGIVIVTGVESSGGSANEFIVTVDPAPAEYTDRMMVSFLATHNNAGDSSIRINALSPVSFTANDGASLAADTIKAGSEVLAVFDGSQFRLVATSNVQRLPPDELPSQAGHEGQFLTTNGAAAAWQPLTILRNPQAGGYTLLQSDLSKLLYWSGSSPIFIGIVPASALGSGWYSYVYNASTVPITIDPAGSETINGQVNITLQPSQGALIQCNGSNFVTLDFNRLPSPTGQNGKWLTTDGNAAQWADLPSSSLPPQAGQEGKFLSTDGVEPVWETIPFPPNELPPQLGQNGSFLQTNGTTPAWAQIPTELPSQTGNDGRILSTDGTDPLWIDAPTGGGGGGVEELPPQAGQAGRFLQTNGTDPAWALVPNELPSMTGQSGAFLSTDGTSPVWSTVPAPAPELPPMAGQSGLFLSNNGTDPSWATVPPTPPELPAQAGQAGKVLTTDGTTPAWTAPVSNIKVLPIFSPEALLNTPAFGGNTLNIRVTQTFASGNTHVSYNSTSGLFIATGQTAINGNFYTSPDAINWTAKPITVASAAEWAHASSGAVVIAVPLSATLTGTYRSTDGGVTWIAGGAFSSAATTGTGPLVAKDANTFLLQRGASSMFLTTNAGVSWTTQTPPATTTNSIFCVGGLFIAWISGTSYYTSSTGLTGSWTSRTLPDTPNYFSMSMDRNSVAFVATSTRVLYETTDGITWNNTGIVGMTNNGGPIIKITDDIYYYPIGNNGSQIQEPREVNVFYDKKVVAARRPVMTLPLELRNPATNGNGTYLFTGTAMVYVMDNATTGLFY